MTAEGFSPEPTLDGGGEPGVQRFRKRPVVIEAVQWTGGNEAALATFCGSGPEGPLFEAPAGDARAAVWNSQGHAWIPCPADHYVVKGLLGEFYPISPEALEQTYDPAPAEPEGQSPLPEGEYARVEIMGHDYHTGWVTERDRAGVRVLAIADWDGRVMAEVPGQSLYRYVPLPTPLKRPEPAAITRANPDYDGDGWDSRGDGYDLGDDDEEGPF